jgi:ABC-type glycerol-3-phosphate transport system substrate-binding protein
MKHIIIALSVLAVIVSWENAFAQEKKLVIWSHWGDDPVKVTFMNAVAAEFQKETGISVDIVWLPKIELMEKLVFALDTSEPDIAYIDTGFTHPRIWRSLADLSDLRFTGQLDSSWRLGSVGGERVNNYLPIEGVSHGIYYNTHLFEKAGIVLPQDRPITDKEFLDIIRKLRAAGITPIGEGTADRTVKVGIPIINTIFRYVGPEKIIRLYKGEVNFSDLDVLAALQYWKQVVDAQGYDASKVLQLTLNEGIFEVTDGNAAMSFCGSWIYGKYGKTEHDQGQIGVLDWFTVENGNGNGYYEIFWPAGFGINQNSAHLDAARRFLEYLMTPSAAAF